MNDLSPPSLDVAQGADVLATIRRLLAQDASSPDDAVAREGALRRRLIGTRRRGSVAAQHPVDDVLPLDEVDAAAVLPQPLRLADNQRIAAPGADEASPVRDESLCPMAEASAETALSFVTAAAPESLAEPAAPEADLDPLPLSMPSVPGMVTPSIAPALFDAGPFLHDVSTSGDTACGTWPFAAHPADRLRELLAMRAWIAEPDADAEAVAAITGPSQPVTEPELESQPEPQPVAEADTLAQAPVSPQQPVPDASLLRALIRETLMQELAGETGAKLGAAIRQLARDAIAGALTDLARGMAVPEASGHQADE